MYQKLKKSFQVINGGGILAGPVEWPETLFLGLSVHVYKLIQNELKLEK